MREKVTQIKYSIKETYYYQLFMRAKRRMDIWNMLQKGVNSPAVCGGAVDPL